MVILNILIVSELNRLQNLSPCWSVLDFPKNKFGRIKFEELEFWSILKRIFTASVACKDQFRNWFPFHRTWFFQLDFSKFKYGSTRSFKKRRYKSVFWIFFMLFFKMIKTSNYLTIFFEWNSVWCTSNVHPLDFIPFFSRTRHFFHARYIFRRLCEVWSVTKRGNRVVWWVVLIPSRPLFKGG